MVNYTAVIRTLGTAGDKYQRLLNSLMSQTFPPQAILVYIAKGFPIPQETVGVERYIYVDKGMTAQRALRYEEVTTEYMLCLDDDLEFPPDTVEIMFALLKSHSADVVSPDIFPNHLRASHSELMMTIAGRMRPRFRDNYWGYKVMTTAGYSYNKYPRKEAYFSQTNAGACFLCKKEDFLKIDFEDELWMDKMQYPIGEDQTMYYKMHCRGLKVLTWYGHQFIHLDAGNNMTREKEMRRLYGDVFYKIVFWHRFLYDQNVVGCMEPYNKRTSHGMILGSNGEKMSKSRGNVVNPDDIVREFGADTLRTYEMFIGAFDLSASWQDEGVKGCRRFLDRVWKLQDIMTDEEGYSADLETKMHQTIKKVSGDFESLKFNTAIAAMMALINDFYKKNAVTKGEYKTLITLLNPVAPHITEELWTIIGGSGRVYQQTWPEYDEAKTVESTVEIAVQINGKVKATLNIGKDDPKDDVIAKAKECIADKLTGTIVKEIYVPGRLVNIVQK